MIIEYKQMDHYVSAFLHASIAPWKAKQKILSVTWDRLGIVVQLTVDRGYGIIDQQTIKQFEFHLQHDTAIK